MKVRLTMVVTHFASLWAVLDATKGPLANVDECRRRPVNELAGLLPDEQAVDAAIRTCRLPTSTSRPYAFCTARLGPHS
jgi:hypothetical protein